MTKSRIGLHVIHANMVVAYFNRLASKTDVTQFSELYSPDNGKPLPTSNRYYTLEVGGSFYPSNNKTTQGFSTLKVAQRKVALYNEAYKQTTPLLHEFENDMGENRILVEGVPSLKGVPYTFTMPLQLNIKAIGWCRVVRDFCVIGFEAGTDMEAMASLVTIPYP